MRITTHGYESASVPKLIYYLRSGEDALGASLRQLAAAARRLEYT
jgi:hypothetical protein